MDPGPITAMTTPTRLTSCKSSMTVSRGGVNSRLEQIGHPETGWEFAT